jgi:uncharacterized protein
MTSAFARKYYLSAIVKFAITSGAEKVMYPGDYPMRLSLDRIFDERRNLPFRDHVRPLFLRANDMRIFKVGERE